jgi:pheromone shutdown protein TraB
MHPVTNTRCQAYLLGTAHVSERSERAVRQLISAGNVALSNRTQMSAHLTSSAAVKPGVVMVELCPPRAAALRRGAATLLPTFDTLPFEVPGLAQLARQFAFANGRDLRAALESADACQAKVLCGDISQVNFVNPCQAVPHYIGY